MPSGEPPAVTEGRGGGMGSSADPNDVSAILSAQCRRQDRLDRERMTWWIPWIFVVGLCFSALGLFASAQWIHLGGALRLADVFVAACFVMFGLYVGIWLIWPLMIKPRIVPYFAREIET